MSLEAARTEVQGQCLAPASGDSSLQTTQLSWLSHAEGLGKVMSFPQPQSGESKGSSFPGGPSGNPRGHMIRLASVL